MLLFTVVATANAGGYRYGVSDQAFYIPAIALRAHPDLFPRDRAVFEPQMRFWVGDEVLGTLVRVTGITLPTLFGSLYVLTMGLFVGGAIALARALGLNWWTITAGLILMTLRHRIARTGANSLEGYMHPRMLAFALGLLALAAVTRLRLASAITWVGAAALVHASTAIWFGGAVIVAALWQHRQRTRLLGGGAGLAVLGLAVGPSLAPSAFIRMDETWLRVLADRDYLFSLDWPAWAWLLNLGYPILILMIHRRRAARGTAVPGESGLVAGLLALVAVFLATLPFVESRFSFFVQLQANRVFWLLDAVLMLLVAWLLMDDLGRRWPVRARLAVILVLAALPVARGVYVLRVETTRPLVQATLPEDFWTDAMRWLGTQPVSWHVLADPNHVWKHGASVRVAAFRDTVLEFGKDPAMAMYDYPLALRVDDRTRALADFDTLTLADIRRLDAKYDLDVFIDRSDRQFALPELFRNSAFVAYDLR